MTVVCNNSPLMWLEKAGRLALLRLLYGRVMIPEEVHREAVEKGMAEGFADAFIIREAVEEGWLEISTPAVADEDLSAGWWRLHPRSMPGRHRPSRWPSGSTFPS